MYQRLLVPAMYSSVADCKNLFASSTLSMIVSVSLHREVRVAPKCHRMHADATVNTVIKRNDELLKRPSDLKSPTSSPYDLLPRSKFSPNKIFYSFDLCENSRLNSIVCRVPFSVSHGRAFVIQAGI